MDTELQAWLSGLVCGALLGALIVSVILMINGTL